MDFVFNMWGIFGFIAFISTCTLQAKVSKLERQIREMNAAGNLEHGGTLHDSLQKRIGCYVKFSFYDDEEDIELALFDGRKGFIQIVDVDDKWVQVHCENKNEKMDKLIRISSIKGIEEIE